MTAINERFRFPTPPEELERRWSGVRAKMDTAGTDALVIHNHVQGLGGYVKWFADAATSNGYPLSIVFPHSGPMTLVMHGPHGADRPADPSLHGVERVLCTWSFQSASFTAHDDGDALVRALRDAAPKAKRVGLVGLAQIPFGLVEHAFAVEAWETCAARLRPGASSAEVFTDYNAFMRGQGAPRRPASTPMARDMISSSVRWSAAMSR